MTEIKKTAAKKTATKKAAPIVETVKVETVDQFKALQAAFVESFKVRAAHPDNSKCKTIIADITKAESETFVRQLRAIVDNGFMTIEALQNLARACAICDKSNADFVALKVITKIISTIYALATKQKSQLDGYVNALFANIAKNQFLTSKSGMVSLCKNITYDELEQVQSIARILSVSEKTAATQLSQVRQLLRLTHIGNAIKGKRNDVISFNDSPQALAIVAFYS